MSRGGGWFQPPDSPVHEALYGVPVTAAVAYKKNVEVDRRTGGGGGGVFDGRCVGVVTSWAFSTKHIPFFWN